MRFPVLLAVVLALTRALSGAVPADGLVGQWSFTENFAAAKSGAGLPLVLSQASVQREPGGAVSLVCDGFDGGGVVDERSPLRFGTGCTLAIWVWPTRERGSEPVFGRPNPNPAWTTPVTGLQLAEGCPVFGLFSPQRKLLLEGPPLPLRAWSLVVATADGARVALWVNGRQVAEAAQTLPIPPASGQPWYLGRSALQHFRGRLGEAWVWARALPADEVAAVHAASAPGYAGRAPRVAAASGASDQFVPVESPGSRTDAGTWRFRPTRTLAGLRGFTAGDAPAVDRWGGRTDRPARNATGFFRAERVDGRWWLVTPEGHLYWNVAINSVRPPRSVPAAQTGEFAARVTRELRELGFNGLGNGSLPALQAVDSALPWSIRLNFMASFAQHHRQTYPTSGHTGFTEQCFPVFHPDFPAWARRQAEALKATLGDASAVGIFTDNELQCPSDLLDRHLKLPETDPYLGHGRRAALAWLEAEKLSADPSRLTLRDRYRFIAHVFGTYARIVHDAIREVDTRHLILGPRFNVHRGQFDNPWFWKAVGPWIDVVAVNYYVLWGPQSADLREWSEAMQRPILLTEWYSKAQDAPKLSNAKGAGWLVRTQLDRARYYQHFVLAAYETPELVGFHYFKYLDDDADSVALDSAGGANKGICHADGTPWIELQDAARAVNRQVYPLLDFFDVRRRDASMPKERAP